MNVLKQNILRFVCAERAVQSVCRPGGGGGAKHSVLHFGPKYFAFVDRFMLEPHRRRSSTLIDPSPPHLTGRFLIDDPLFVLCAVT